VQHLEAIIRRNLNDFIDHQEASNLLASEIGAAEVTGDTEKLTAFTIVLRALASEEVPIFPPAPILRQFSQSLAEGKDLTHIVEGIRSLPDIRPLLLGNNAAYSFYRLGKRMTAGLAQSLRAENGSQFLAMVPEQCQEALAAVRDKIASQRNVALVVEQPELRPLVRRLTEVEFPNAPVLSSQELRSELTTRIVGEIELP
jgi:flagellar biosynthesis component FlhA